MWPAINQPRKAWLHDSLSLSFRHLPFRLQHLPFFFAQGRWAVSEHHATSSKAKTHTRHHGHRLPTSRRPRGLRAEDMNPPHRRVAIVPRGCSHLPANADATADADRPTRTARRESADANRPMLWVLDRSVKRLSRLEKRIGEIHPVPMLALPPWCLCVKHLFRRFGR